MIEDRRKFPRYPVLIRCTLVTSRDRRDAVCTQIGPAAGFLTCRLESLVAGEIVRVELRSGGLGTPIITLLGLIVRVDAPAAGNPGGLAVRWRAATCDLGPEALSKFLKNVIRLTSAPAFGMATDMHAQFDLEASLAGRDVQIVSSRGDATQRGASEAMRASAARSASFSAVARPALSDTGGQRPVIAPRKEFGLLDDPGLRPMAAAAPSQPFPTQLPAHQAQPAQSIQQMLTTAAGQPRPLAAAPHPASVSAVARSADPPPASPLVPAIGQVAASGALAGAALLHTALRPSRSAIPVLPADQPAPGAMGQPVAGHPAGGAVLSNTRRSSSALAVVLPPVDRSVKPRSERTPALGWSPPSIAARSAGGPPRQENPASQFAGRTSAPAATGGLAERSELFDVAAEASQAVGMMGESSSDRERLGAASFPVYALGMAERRVQTNPDTELPRLATANFDMSGEATENARDIVLPLGVRPKSVANVADALRRRAPSANFDSQMMLHADFPVRFTVGAELRSGHLVSLGSQAVAVITHEGAPELDQKVTVFLPVMMAEGPMVLDLRGKLLQVVTLTEAGPRFVMHIERVEEGHHPGAFQRLLHRLAGR